MLSIILYGRNDSYGYNLHKRAALSLNCMAELLTDADDELLFVDYNTPDDFPTFPEAIRDTLTAQAKQRLRIFRVRPALHAPFRDRTHLFTLEPHARNVALRRSNPANKWVLSTNTDMIFVPRRGRSLTDIANTRTDGFYHLPRFELPETLWEELDRLDPAGVIDAAGRWGWELHLNEIVHGAPSILYDAPGDFQLMARADLFRIHGFDERMLLGWHVDSNIARRLGLFHGRPGSLVDELFGYHCDHTRQVTPMHRPDKIENDLARFVDDVSSAELPGQAEHWGFAHIAIEETRLTSGPSRYLSALQPAIGAPMAEPSRIEYSASSYDRVGYDARHVLPFLIDALSSYRRDIRLAWFGAGQELLDRFTIAWRELGFEQPVLVPGDLANRGEPAAGDIAECDVLVFDFGSSPPAETTASSYPQIVGALRQVTGAFRQAVNAERRRLASGITTPRRFIVVNTVHGRFETLVRSHLAAPTAPISTRLRQGYVRPALSGPTDLMPGMLAGTAGQRDGTTLIARAGMRGHAVYGPYIDLMPGRYRATLSIASAGGIPEGPGSFADLGTPIEVMALEIVSGEFYFAYQPVTAAMLAAGEITVCFDVPAALTFHIMSLRIELRLATSGRTTATISAVTLERLPDAAEAPEPAWFEWLPLMSVGSAGLPLASAARWHVLLRRALGRPAGRALAFGSAGAVARRRPGHVLFGPYCQLVPGRYEIELELAPIRGDRRVALEAGQLTLDIRALDGTTLACLPVPARQLDASPQRLEFAVPDRLDADGQPIAIEFRLWT
ncbi:MAG TPA: hypothetical protein VFW75_07130, partial [Acetobacteraceae bacterium]|nr:hypothetical protein [Acetobacteraceae bacterium]